MPNFSALNLTSRLSNQGIEEEAKIIQRIGDIVATVPFRHFSGILSGIWYSGVFLCVTETMLGSA